jgi:hypothetical protein
LSPLTNFNILGGVAEITVKQGGVSQSYYVAHALLDFKAPYFFKIAIPKVTTSALP